MMKILIADDFELLREDLCDTLGAQALRNIVAFTDHPVQDVIPLMTANPAKALRMDDRKGSIEVGKDADMVLLDDALNVVTTVGLGRVIYTA